MSEPQSNGGLGRDALGLLLIVIGVFFGAFTVMATIQPKDNPNTTTAAFMTLVGGVGSVAGMFLALGILVVGVRLWIAGISGRIGRDVLGVLVTTITLATLMGAVSDGLGGSVGELLGGRVSAFLTPFVGIPYGLCVVLLPAWFLWLRPRALLAWDEAGTVEPTVGQSTGQATGQTTGQTPGQGPSRDSERGFGHAFGSARIKTTDAGSVSAAEAAALLPPTPAARPASTTSPSRPAAPVAQSAPRPAVPADAIPAKPSNLPRNNAPSPYPVDVRVHGGIPEGARPLETPHARTVQQSPPHAAAVQLGLARDPSAAQQPAGAHLADAERVHEPRIEHKLVVERSPARERAPGGEVGAHASGAAPRAEIPVVGQPAGAPTFDISSDDDGDAEADLAFADETPEPFGAAPPIVPFAADVKPFSATPPAPSWEQPGLFEEPVEGPVDAYGTPLSLVDELRKSNGETALRLDDEPPVAQSAVDTLSADRQVETEPAPEPRGLFDDEIPARVAPNDERAEATPYDDDEDEDDGADALLALDEDTEVDEPERETAERRVVVDPTLDVDAEVPEVVPETVPEVVLMPKAPPAPRTVAVPAAAEPKAKSKPKLELAVDDLVYRAGCLFLERQRVAVSMLQRDFGLDFKAATEVLDQLQKAGLIGPYLGGQRRDILITREQWDELARVS